MNQIGDALLQGLMDDMARVARAEILPRFAAIASESARAKSAPDDLVTDADIAAERALGLALTARLPGVVLVGEEAVAEDRAVLSQLAGADLAAVIDPVDGTWNFAHGIPVFGSILALVARGRTLAGLIHYPVTGDFIAARPGLGAWHIGPDGAKTRLRVAAPAPLAQMAGFLPLHLLPAADQARLAPRLPLFKATMSWRCSAFEYRLLAGGAMSFGLSCGLMPWDHAAGVLIHAEAGGHAALLDGRAYSPALTEGHLLAAPDAASWAACRQALS